MRTLNLGIVAHVDAGKTTLTERLLYAAGVIDEIGSVDDGSTQTDTLALERQRGITIKAAVVSFAIGDVAVNLIDTPGHPDFIAEVERVLGVLDGAVLVISAVEGVQSQTRVLARTLQRLRIPYLIFVNKMDRMGADAERTVRAIDDKLSRAEVDVLFGSAIKGDGVDGLMAAIAKSLPSHAGEPGGALSGTVFKIERDAKGEKLAYVRLFGGSIVPRQRVLVRGAVERKVTRIAPGPTVTAPNIAKVSGLGDVQIGDAVGVARDAVAAHHFAPPTLETVVVAARPQDRGALHVALAQLAEQDPLINLRQDDVRQETHVSLYGEVQKQVIEETLAADYGIPVEWRETTTICIERLRGVGTGFESHRRRDTFLATVGLRVEPAPIGSGVEYRRANDVLGTMSGAFFRAVEETVHETLQQGVYGWEVTDCVVTLTHTGYSPRQSAMHQSFNRNMSSTAWDFRTMTPLVLMAALKQAGTTVYEPMHRFLLEFPEDAFGAVVAALGPLGAIPGTPVVKGTTCELDGEMPAARVHELQLMVPGLTRGEGVLESTFDSYRPVAGKPPRRERTDHNPLDRKEYLQHIMLRD